MSHPLFSEYSILNLDTEDFFRFTLNIIWSIPSLTSSEEAMRQKLMAKKYTKKIKKYKSII